MFLLCSKISFLALAWTERCAGEGELALRLTKHRKRPVSP